MYYTILKFGIGMMTKRTKFFFTSNPYYLWAIAIFFIACSLFINFYFTAVPSPAVITLSQEPSIRLYKNFLTQDEAQHLIALAKARLNRSTVQVKNEKVLDHQRTSRTAYLLKSEDKIVKAIEQRACALVGCQESHMEPIQVVHYTKGQKYSPHHDYFSEKELPFQTGQRVHTFLLYLNDVPKSNGGSTRFPELNIDVQPNIGTALYFQDTNNEGQVQPKTLHGGSEIKGDGEKWACNIWIRDKPFVKP
jgi:prolyl 4-hydroxylase